MVNKIPDQLYRTKELTLGNGEKVQIKGHRGGDYPLLKKLSKVERDAMKLSIKLSQLTTTQNDEGLTINKLDSDLTDKEIDQLLDLRAKIEDLQDETRPLINKLAQRGVKRFYYPGKKTEEIDKIEDIELNMGEALSIHQAMNELDNPLSPNSVDDQGKSKTK